MELATRKQTQFLYFLFVQKGLDESERHAFVLDFTKGRVKSLKELTVREARTMISSIANNDTSVNDNSLQAMRNKLFGMAHEMRWQTAEKKIDIERVDAWCVTYGYGHKKLKDYTYNELPKLITQFRAVYEDYLKNLVK